MEQPLINGSIVRKYLLGELAEEERERIEVSLLTSESFYETLTALEDEVEDELIDQYTCGELSERERERFEQTFLTTPERAEKLKLVMGLNEHAVLAARERARAVLVGAHAEPAAATRPAAGPPSWSGRLRALNVFQNPLVGFACAVALLVSMLGVALLLIRSERLETQLAQSQARVQPAPAQDAGLREEIDRLRARNEELSASLTGSEEQRAGLEKEVASLRTGEGVNRATPRPSETPSARTPVYSVVLTPALRGGSGGGQPGLLTLPTNEANARLIMRLGDIDPKGYATFQAIVTKGDEEVTRSDRVSISAKRREVRAVATLSARLLRAGQYTVELRGVSRDGGADALALYTLQVETK